MKATCFSIMAMTAMRPMQFMEQAGMEEKRPEAETLAEIVDDLKYHSDVAWIAASQDARYPLLVIGKDEPMRGARDPDLMKFAEEWIAMWEQMYPSQLDIWIVAWHEQEFYQEFEVLVDKRHNFERPRQFMERFFFQPNPFQDNGPLIHRSGLEEPEMAIERAA